MVGEQTRRRKKRNQQNLPALTSAEIWSGVYHSLVQWQRTQMLNFCSKTQSTKKPHPAHQQLTHCQHEDSPDDEEGISTEYLNFLEVTIKHQEELKRMRATPVEKPTAGTTEDATIE